MPEGDSELNGKREERQPASTPSVVTKPTHERLSPVAHAKFQDAVNCSGRVAK